MMEEFRATIREIVSKWQGGVSITDTPAISLLVLQQHPALSPGACERLVLSEVLDRALSARQIKMN